MTSERQRMITKHILCSLSKHFDEVSSIGDFINTSYIFLLRKILSKYGIENFQLKNGNVYQSSIYGTKPVQVKGTFDISEYSNIDELVSTIVENYKENKEA